MNATRGSPGTGLVPLADAERYRRHYSGPRLRDALRRRARRVGREAVEQILTLWYAMLAPTTPAWARAVIAGALGYFISLVDAIPDITPFVGYTDDLGVLAAALAVVARSVTPAIRDHARERARRWFPDPP